MPGYTEVAPYLHVSTYASWHDVGAWYWRLVEEQMVPDDSIRKAARSVLEPGMTDAERVRAIHGLVVTRHALRRAGVRDPRLSSPTR